MRNRQKWIAILLAVVLMIAAMPVTTFSVTAEAAAAIPAGYVGICDTDDLNAIRHNLAGNYILMNDIVFPEDGEVLFEPIGSYMSPFSGVLDGNGYAIRNMQVFCEDVGNVRAGLFACLSGTVRRLGMENCAIGVTSSYSVYIGAIAATMKSGSLVEECYFNGTILGVSEGVSIPSVFAGGIAGTMDGGRISRCYNAGAIMAMLTHTDDRGGIMAYVGGMVGWMGYGAEVEDCFDTSSLSGITLAVYTNINAKSYVGGIAGLSRGKISRCYAAGRVEALSLDSTMEFAGGIVALSEHGNAVESSYYLKDLVGDTDASGRGTACTREQLKQAATFAGFDFDTVWRMDDADGYQYPKLRCMDLRMEEWVTHLEVLNQPNKTTYQQYEETIDLTGGRMHAYYAGGREEDVVMTNEMLYMVDLSVAGRTLAAVEYKTAAVYIPITVTKKNVTRLELVSLPKKLQYVEGDEFSADGLQVVAHYEDGTTRPVEDYTLSGTALKAGTNVIRVRYDNQEARFTVYVEPRQMVSIEVTKPLNKMVYKEGEEFDESGLEISARYNDGTYEVLPIMAYTVKGYTSTPGKKILTVDYNGKTTTLTVTVEAVMKGDVNEDGKVTITDMLAVKSCILGKTKLKGLAKTAADTNRDGSITITDFIQIKSHLLGKTKLQ